MLEQRQVLQQRLEQRLSQSQIQALKVLQLPTVELEKYIRQKAEENPFIEITEPSEGDYISLDSGPSDHQPNDEVTTNFLTDSHMSEDESLDQAEMTELEPDYNPYSHETDTSIKERLIDLSYNPEFYESLDRAYANYRSTPSLKSELFQQLHLQVEDPEELLIGEVIIAYIDERGYFVGDLKEIAEELNQPVEKVESVLKIIQTFEPLGVGARDVKECLLIQVEKLFPDNELMKKLITEYSEELIQKQIFKIAKGLGITPQKVDELLQQIRDSLNPHPGYEFPENPEYIKPDVVVRITEDNEIEIELADKQLPSIKIVERISNEQIKTFTDEEKQQIRKLRESAMQLKREIELRKSTLYKVAKKIVELQENFIRNGIEHLKPMTYKDIAKAIDIHESTVSRCVAGKYIQTPQGIFELRKLFTGGKKIHSNGEEEEISISYIKQLIKTIVDEEDKNKPLSDQEIADKIKKEHGIDIARRTVSKYREELKIPNAFKRKKH